MNQVELISSSVLGWISWQFWFPRVYPWEQEVYTYILQCSSISYISGTVSTHTISQRHACYLCQTQTPKLEEALLFFCLFVFGPEKLRLGLWIWNQTGFANKDVNITIMSMVKMKTIRLVTVLHHGTVRYCLQTSSEFQCLSIEGVL